MTELTKKQQIVFDAIKELADKNPVVKSFLSSPPMSGKTFLFQYVEDYFKENKMVEINVAQPIFLDNEETLNKFVDAIMNGINKRVRKGLWDIKESEMADYEFNTTPAKVIQLEEIYGRLDRLERYAHVSCWRCSKEIAITSSRFLTHPGVDEEIPLCCECYSDYEDLSHNKETELKDAQRSFLKEIRRQKK